MKRLGKCVCGTRGLKRTLALASRKKQNGITDLGEKYGVT